MNGDSDATVLIFDEYPLIREGLICTLNGQNGLVVCAETGDADEVLSLAEEHDPDVAIVSIDAHGISGLGLVGELHVRHPQLKVLVLSRRDETHAAGPALRAGAKGYLAKWTSPGRLLEAVTTMLDGEIAISDSAADLLLEHLVSSTSNQGTAAVSTLSRREMEVLELTGCGLSRREIAERLNLSTRTVDSYRARMKGKLGLRTMPELARFAVNWLENGEETIHLGL
ncbi:MAG: response regulator transcription factor [Bacteroidetes bacterium]|nr:response regulator transcription factor [Bacteroidota bacterium]